MVRVYVWHPSGEERMYEYELGMSVHQDKRAVCVYTRGQSKVLAVFPIAGLVRVEVSA